MSRDRAFYLPELDGLRFFAFLAVFTWHFASQWVDMTKLTTLAKVGVGSLWIGNYGVDLFFTLSAYLITELLMRERQMCGVIDVRSFYIRRALRIWPLYFGALFALLICSFFIPQLASARGYLPWFCLFAGNFAMRVGALPPLAVAPLWSVSVEEQFYFLWPLVLRRLTRRGAIHAALVLWALGLGFRTFAPLPSGDIIFSTLARLDPIAAGILIAAFLNGSVRIESRIAASTSVTCGALLWTFAYLVSVTVVRNHWLPLAESFIALGSAAFLVAAIKGGGNTVLSNRVLVYLGRISYGLYVFHGAVIMGGIALFGVPSEWFAQAALMALELAATIAFAAASYRWFESPFLKLKRRFQHVRSGSDAGIEGHCETGAGVRPAMRRAAWL
jgi:peptidoglycan/LPS O-acetylase OafA/YrhL